MLHQAEEIGQVGLVYPLLVEREEEEAGAGVDEVVRILDALGDAFGGQQLADAVIRNEGGKFLIRNLGIDRHAWGSRDRIVPQRLRQREEYALIGGRNRLHG